MKVHEYQAKELLKKRRGRGSRGDRGRPAPTEAAKAYDELGGGLIVVKAQVHAGGRGKGVADRARRRSRTWRSRSPAGGKPRPEAMAKGVQLVKSAQEAEAAAASLLGKTLVTYQTGAEGQAISKVLVTVGHDIARELYLGMAVDRGLQCPVLMAIDRGGRRDRDRGPRDAREDPPRADRRRPRPGRFPGPEDLQGARALTGETAKKGATFFKHFVQAVHRHGRLARRDQPADRHGQPATSWRSTASSTSTTTRCSATPTSPRCSTRPRKTPPSCGPRKSGLSYVSLDGDIACLVNGAGLAMSTMDLIKYHGGEPANFLDVGGGANKDQVLEGVPHPARLEPRVKAVLVNIFGGIMKCDTIAAALLAAYDEIDFRVPLVVRLEGTNVELGKKLLKESGRKIITADGLTDAAQKVVAAAKGAA